MAMLRDRAAKTPAGDWLLFTGFDNLLQGGDVTMADLDAASKDHPILVYYINMHTAAGNSLAFARARSRRISAICRAADGSAATPGASSTA